MSVLSLKGGVGKTSVTLGLAGAAAAQSVRCVVVDLDPQANATTVLAPGDVKFTANDVLGDHPVPIGDAVTVSGWGEPVRVLAGEPALERRNHPPDGVAGRHHVRTALAGLRDTDLVLLDCPPSLAELTRNALAASDVALVVTEPTAFALAGAQQALDAVDAVRRAHNLRLRPAGIIVNRFRAGSAEHRYRLDELIAAYRDLVIDPVVPDRSAVSRAQGAGLPVQRWPSPGAREVGRIFAGYLKLIMSSGGSGAGPFSKGARR